MTPPTSGATNEYTVTPADMQALLSGQDGADLETVSREGKPAAMRVFGVRPGSVAARLGAQNGDQIESVNDVPVGAAGAMSQWTQSASREGRLTIKGVRAGQPFTTVLRVEGR